MDRRHRQEHQNISKKKEGDVKAIKTTIGHHFDKMDTNMVTPKQQEHREIFGRWITLEHREIFGRWITLEQFHKKHKKYIEKQEELREKGIIKQIRTAQQDYVKRIHLEIKRDKGHASRSELAYLNAVEERINQDKQNALIHRAGLTEASVIPFTIDEYKKSPFENKEKYHEWLKEQRKKDKRNLYREYSRIYRFKNPERVKAWKSRIKAKTIEKHCVVCNSVFTTSENRLRHIYCSLKCGSKATSRRYAQRNYIKVGKVKKSCVVCKKDFMTIRHPKIKYCSRICYYKEHPTIYNAKKSHREYLKRKAKLKSQASQSLPQGKDTKQ